MLNTSPIFLTCIVSVEALAGSKVRFPRSVEADANVEDFIATVNSRRIRASEVRIKSIVGLNTAKIITRNFISVVDGKLVCDLTDISKNAVPISYAYEKRSNALIMPNMIRGTNDKEGQPFFLNAADIILYAMGLEKLL